MASGAKMWLQEPRCDCMSQDMAFKVHVWLLEQCFYIIAVEGRDPSKLMGQRPVHGSVGKIGLGVV